MNFDYLHESVPEPLDRLRHVKIAAELQTPVRVFIAALVFVVFAGGIERYRLTDARSVETQAASRAEASRAALAQTNLARVKVDRLLALDRRLRGVRISGSIVAEHFIDVADHLPRGVWLTSLARREKSVEIVGKAEGVNAIAGVVAGLMAGRTVHAPALISAGRDDRSQVMSFEMRAEDRL